MSTPVATRATLTRLATTRSRARDRGAVVARAKGRNSRFRNDREPRRQTTTTTTNESDDGESVERLEANARGGRRRNASSSSAAAAAAASLANVVPGDADAAQRKRIVKMKLEADKRRAEEERKRAEFDVKYAKRSTQGIPEVVTDRMLKRVGIFCGTPLIFGFMTGPAFYFAKAVKHIDVPPAVFFTASTVTFGAAFLGISYGVLSASWDPRREGSFWGGAEFKENIPILVSTVMGKASGTTPLEWDDETDEDF